MTHPAPHGKAVYRPRKFNPHVDEWKRLALPDARDFPQSRRNSACSAYPNPKPMAHGLDYSYSIVCRRRVRHYPLRAAYPLAIGVATTSWPPALTAIWLGRAREEFFCAPATAGRNGSGCIAVPKPGGGSDVASIRTTRARHGDDYVINWQPRCGSNSPSDVDFMCLAGQYLGRQTAQQQSLILDRLKTPVSV